MIDSVDIVNTAIEKLIAILIPGWSRADYLVEPNQIYIYYLFGIFIDDEMKKKMGTKRFL